jgi:hypothetical protein
MGSVHLGNGFAGRVETRPSHFLPDVTNHDHLIFVHGLKEPVNSDGSPTPEKTLAWLPSGDTVRRN